MGLEVFINELDYKEVIRIDDCSVVQPELVAIRHASAFLEKIDVTIGKLLIHIGSNDLVGYMEQTYSSMILAITYIMFLVDWTNDLDIGFIAIHRLRIGPRNFKKPYLDIERIVDFREDSRLQYIRSITNH
uniref:Uncharacterized protein n=1 Tax=Megaselia scalaris TaxID=36166 RepID=T1GQN7_MEGSC